MASLAVDAASNVSLADYTWLPIALHEVFQTTLETPDGVAKLHFVAAIEKMTRGEYQPRVIAVSSDAVYICTNQADIVRCIGLESITSILYCDEWICLVIPSEYDLAFRVVPPTARHETVNQAFYFDIMKALNARFFNRSLPIQAVATIHGIISRQLERPGSFVDRAPVPISVIPFAELSDQGGIRQAHHLVRNLLPSNAAACPATTQRQSSPSKLDSIKLSLHHPLDPPVMQPIRHTPAMTAQVAAHSPGRSPPSFDDDDDDGPPPGSPPSFHQPSMPPHQQVYAANAASGSPLASQSKPSPPKRQSPSPRRKVTRATSPPPKKATDSHRFTDPCLELVWDELMTQKGVLEKLTAQMKMLLEQRFPVIAPKQEPERRTPPGRAAPPTMTFVDPTPAPQPSVAGGFRRGPARQFPIQLEQAQARVSPGPPSRHRVQPRVEATASELEDLTPFQRRLITRFLHEETAPVPPPAKVAPVRHDATPRSTGPRGEDARQPGRLTVKQYPTPVGAGRDFSSANRTHRSTATQRNLL